jgi:CPA2 family monovalent cation:H+ antiporter-2
MDTWSILIEITALLGLGALLGTLAERLGVNALIGYLLAGLCLGPGGFRLIGGEHVGPVAELGVALLLFTTGLEFSFRRLRRLGAVPLWGGALQIVATILLAAALARVFGWEPRRGLALGAIVCLSSTASVLRLLQDRTELETVTGRTSLGILLVQDVALVPLVLLVTLLGGTAGASSVAPGTRLTVAAALMLLIVLLPGGLRLMPRLLGHAVLTRNRELPILAAVAICLGATWSAHALGLSPALGAFAAGMVLADSPFATQVRADVGSLRALFLALFFIAIGMLARLDGFARHALVLPLAVAAILIVKTAVTALVLRLLRLPLRHAVATGVAVSQVGEFGFVLLQVADRSALFPPEVTEVLLLSIFCTLLLTPFLLPFAHRWGARRLVAVPDAAEDEAAAERGRNHVIVVGYGPAGQGAVEGVHRRGLGVLIVDASPGALNLARTRDLPVLLGDATYPEILDNAHLSRARALVITIPDPSTGLAILRLARGMEPALPIVVRSRYHRFAEDMEREGATRIFDEEAAAGTSLAEMVETCLDAC